MPELLSFEQLLMQCGRLVAAFLLALPVAWDREQARRTVGLRTFPLVALASCGFVLIGRTEFAGDSGAQARALQGLITGVGFIGGGAILRNNGHVFGTATAASLWATAAVGAAVAYDRYEIAILLALATVICLRAIRPLKEAAGNGTLESPEDCPDEEDGRGS